MSRWKSTFIIFLAVLVMLTGVLPVFANQIEERKRELDAVRGDLDQTKRAQRENEQLVSKLLREINYLKNDIDVITAEIRVLAKRITNTEKAITQTEEELADAEQRVAEMDEMLAVRLRAIHENGNVNYLEVLFNSSTFTEFLTRYNDLQLIIEEDRVLLTERQAERERVAGIKENLEERREDLLVSRKSSESKRQQLEAKERQRERLVAEVQKEIEKQEEAIRQLEAEAKALEAIIRRLQAEKAKYRGTGQMLWPIPEFGPSWITSGYGYRRHPFTGRPGTFHGGVDIGIPHSRWPGSRYYEGEPVHVVAVDNGIAYTYRMGSGYGNLVIVDHGGGVATIYAHNHSFLVSDGQKVYKGQAIATVGSTGFSTGPHLHFEVRIDGVRKDPMPYIR